MSVKSVVTASLSLSAQELDSSRQQYDAIVGSETRRLYGLSLSILDDGGEAEDAVQETLLKAWRSWDSVSVMDQPLAWLTRVCVNYCLNRRRLLHSRGWPPLGLADGRESARAGWGTDIESMDMNRAYRALSKQQRAAITLNYRHGYSVEECAVFMGCRPGTVRTHLERGLSKLRKELNND